MTSRRLRHPCRFAVFIGLVKAALAAESALPQTIEFNRDIRPILSDICYKCHGPDKAKRKADLRFDFENSAKSKLGDHFAIVPGDPAQSELIKRITTHDADDRMPPSDSGLEIKPRQVELLRRWIEQGAKWQAHWSFIAPKRATPPTVKNAAWIRNPVDAFVLARLEREEMQPSPEADRALLLRRVSLDLTGLPPAPDELDAFLADASPEAYERVVDRLLASPAFGERMASRWLDAARYADTSGYQSDGERSMWRWRDWVIDALNHNMPFDRFTIEQLAGDLLPHATREQCIATGFNRNHRGNAEGGIIPEEYAAEYVVDRVDTTATVWLGLTMGCARCHDHKYDPLTQREFYQLFAVFNNVPEKGRAIKIGNSPPYINAPTDAQQRKLADLDSQLRAAEDRLRDIEPKIAAAQKAWEESFNFAAGLHSNPDWEWTITKGLHAWFQLGTNLNNSIGKKDPGKFLGGEGQLLQKLWANSEFQGPGVFLDGKTLIDCGDVGDFGFFDKFTLAARVIPGGKNGTIISRMVESDADSAFASDSEGYSMCLQDGHVQVRMTKRWLDDALRVETEAVLPPGKNHHVAMVYDGSRLASGVKVFIDGRPQKLRVLLDQLNQTFQTKQPLRIGGGGGPSHRLHAIVSDVRVYDRALTDEEVNIVATELNVAQIAAGLQHGSIERAPGESAKMRACFLAEHAPAQMRQAQATVAALREKRDKVMESVPTVMVMQEMAKPRETFVLKRGVYDQPGERVSVGVPASLPPMRDDAPRNRLGFAQWLVSPENPLTARVAVNHQWEMLFGTGLVKTTEDFGSQGEPPSHPELLDWLATEFTRTNWDVKRLLKTLVMSATYRQSSRTTPQQVARDPDNRLLARCARVRLPAETIRDQALAASGLLVTELGGPSVKPYQPKGLQKDLSGTDYVPDQGSNLWRRSLYTFWKRTSPQPTMTTFDASGREMCSVRPSRTDTPLQALALMNDVTFVEAARCLAQRVLREAGKQPEARVRLAFCLVLTREPKDVELAVLLDDLNNQRARFHANPEAAKALIEAGESPQDPTLDPVDLAAYTALAGLILNLDEAVTKQ